MLNQALRRTSGSNVHVIQWRPWSAAHARWCIFIARPRPRAAMPGRSPVMWLWSDACAVVAAEEAERCPDDAAVERRRAAT